MSVVVENLSFHYQGAGGLTNVSFAAKPGQLTALLGPNGTGKSTLLKCIMGLLAPQSGQVLVEGISTKALSPRQLAQRVAYIPQAHISRFSYTVEETILMGTTASLPPLASPGPPQLRAAQNAMAAVGIVHLAGRTYNQLSGGEQQLVLVARALAQNTPILVMDEPTASLDYGNSLRVLAQVKKLAQQGYTVLLSTHSPDHASLFADAVLALQGGQVIAAGPPACLDAAIIRQLYGVEVTFWEVPGGQARFCLPINLL